MLSRGEGCSRTNSSKLISTVHLYLKLRDFGVQISQQIIQFVVLKFRET